MGLLTGPRHTPADLAHWACFERYDSALSQSDELRRMEDRALEALCAFVARGPCYACTSWGKDSTVLAHLVATAAPTVPLVWVRAEPWTNPDCRLVRDVFLAAHPGLAYEEIETHSPRNARGAGTLAAGFRLAAQRFGERYVSGVRADESTSRRLRVARWGESTETTCAPIAHWSARHVWAYLYRKGLPVHPAYACSFGGVLDRDRIRVSSLGGQRGTGHGRAEWERRYYGVEMAALARGEHRGGT